MGQELVYGALIGIQLVVEPELVGHRALQS